MKKSIIVYNGQPSLNRLNINYLQVTLSENVHKFVELSQRIVVEKSVIQSYEEIQNSSKTTTEISVRNYRTVSTSSTSDTLNEVKRETNGTIGDNGNSDLCEKQSCTTVIMTNCINADDVPVSDKPNNNKGSEALIVYSKSPDVTVQRPLKPQSEMDFLVPYNIINNYFSVGVVSTYIYLLHIQHTYVIKLINIIYVYLFTTTILH